MGGKRKIREPRPRRSKGKDKPKIYRKAYHVNLGQSLAQLNGWPKSEESGGGLRGRWADAVSRPLGQLDVEQLELLLSQGVNEHSLHSLWPVIWERLRADICAARGPGLLELMVAQHSFWTHHPHAAAQLVELIDASAKRLELSRMGLAGLAGGFVERYRTGAATSLTK